jgi:hypothetical protein
MEQRQAKPLCSFDNDVLAAIQGVVQQRCDRLNSASRSERI